MTLQKNVQKQQEPSSRSFTIQENISLADKNWFGTGGLARYYCEPKAYLELQEAICFAASQKLAIFMLGEGANILISDEGFNGIVIRPKFTEIILHDETDYLYIQADAGVSFGELITFCLAHQALGLEEFSGIPGTVGGSVFINIHFFEFLLSKFLVQATVIEKTTGELRVVPQEWFNFGYNWSTLHKQDYYLVNATFKLKKATALEAAYAHGRSDEIARQRRYRYPTARTCGSFFRNFYEHEISTKAEQSAVGKKIINIAYYLDSLGIKGKLSYGEAFVSPKHANMLITKPDARSHDVIMLARAMQELLYAHYDLKAQAECRFIGFEKYPLLFQLES